MNGRASVLVPALCGLSCLLMVSDIAHHREPVDFAALRCAGEAIRVHLDPYSINGLHACEINTLKNFRLTLLPDETVPAPFPGYALAFYSFLTVLPVMPAFACWELFIAVCFVTVVLLTARRTGLSLSFVFAATAMLGAWVPLGLGQVIPFTLASMVLSATALVRRQAVAAGGIALFSMIEPHLGLPFCLGLFVVERGTRVILCLGGVAAALLSMFVLTPMQNENFVTHVLPEQALAEVHHNAQVSLTHILSIFGMPDQTAVLIGSIQYLVMVIAGVVVAAVLSRRALPRDLAVLCAPAVASFGGAYNHFHQLTVVTIAAIYLMVSSLRRELLVKVAILLLAIPPALSTDPAHLVVAVLLGAVLLMEMDLGRQSVRPAAILCIVVAESVSQYAIRLRLSAASSMNQTNRQLLAAHARSNDLEVLWRVYVDARDAWQGWVSILVASPELVATLLVIGSAVRLAAE